MIPLRLVRAAASGAIFCCLLATGVSAQVPFLDPLPWNALASADSGRVLLVQLDHFSDNDRGWSANRAGLTGLFPLGSKTLGFVRDRYLSFDTGGLSAAGKWPDILLEGTSETWPDESDIVGWGRLEIGLLSWLRVPLFGDIRIGLASGLPIGSDELYPLSSPSMPVRLLVRKQVWSSRVWVLEGGVGYLGHIDSSRGVLAADAFPDGAMAQAEFVWRPGDGRLVSLAWHGDFFADRASERLWLDWRQPWGETAAVGLTVQREFGGALDRPCDTRIAVTWYFFGFVGLETDGG